MILVVREGISNQGSFLTSYSIDIDRMNTEKISETHFEHNFLSTLRTRSSLILSSDNQNLHALNPKTLEAKLQW